jgi:transcriptional regulator CtsR
MKLEGKLKDGFFEWLLITMWFTTKEELIDIKQDMSMLKWEFDILPQSAQFGLIQEYAEKIGYEVEARHSGTWIVYKMYSKFSDGGANSRSEAQIKAIEQLNEIINK